MLSACLFESQVILLMVMMERLWTQTLPFAKAQFANPYVFVH